uniref:Putative histone binding domain of the death-domain associated protein n=1 Tax=Culex tarsalis TaxID=7177 RepID=A0A1Q3F0E1_CULTA
MDPSSIIVLDSSDEESGEPKRRRLAPPAVPPVNGGSRKVPTGHIRPPPPTAMTATDLSNKVKRIKPITIATNLTRESTDNNNRTPVNDNFAMISYSDEWEKDLQRYQKIVQMHEMQQQNQQQTEPQSLVKKKSPLATLASEENDRKTATPGSSSTADSHSTSRSGKKEKKHSFEKNPIGKEFGELLDACRKADSSPEMELLIQKKLVKYYECVHPDYINSKSFKKTLSMVTADVLANPELVYLKLSSIVEELNIRRKSRDSVMTNENISGSTGSEKKDNQIRRLNRALYILKKRIAKLEEMEVDFDEDINSAYMMEERYKKRAFEIYEKICDITGESKHAHRIVRKPIHFDGTHYPEFNRTIQTFVNRTNTFPDFFDVLKCLQHCNSQYGYRMRRDEMTKIAQDAFIKIGKLLQKRRKTDLYETVAYYTGPEKDPAMVDRKLLDKLEDNKKHYGKIGDLIDKFARVQDNDTEDEAEAGEPSSSLKAKPSSSKPAATVTSTAVAPEGGQSSKKEDDKDTQPPSPSTATAEPTTEATTEEVVPVASTGDDDSKADKPPEAEKPPANAKEDAPTADETGDYEESDEEEEDEEDEMVIKENVKPDTFDDIEISDDEELMVPMAS